MKTDPRVRGTQSSSNAQKRRLTASARAQKGDQLSPTYTRADVVKCCDFLYGNIFLAIHTKQFCYFIKLDHTF